MVGAVVDTGVVDTLEARLENTRRRHEANEYGDLPWAVVEAGIRAVWATEHPSRPVSPRPVNTEGGVDAGVNASGDQVGSSAGGTSRQQGVIHADEVGGVQARGMRSSAAVTPLLVGQPDILTCEEAIEPQLEMAGLISFARGTVATSEEHYPDLRVEFCAVQLLTFTVISRCCSPGVQIALKSCREYLDAGHRAWHFIELTYQVTDALFIGQLEEQLSHIRMGEEETATDYCNRARRILATMRMACVHYSTASYLTHIIKGLTSSYNLLALGRRQRHGGGSRRRECWLCGDPDHLSFECPNRSDSDDDDVKGGRERFGSRRPRRGRNQPRKEKQSTKSSTSAKDANSSAGGKGRGDMEVVLLDSGCSHHLMGTKDAFVNLRPSGDVKHVHGFNGALQDVQGRGTVALQGETGRQMLIPDVLYVPGVRANLLSAGQLKENGLKLQEDGNGMLLISAAGDVLGRASYTGRVLCTDLRPCSLKSTMPTTEFVALRAIVSVTKSTPDRLHARLAHVGMNTIRSSARHEVATGLDLKSASGTDLPCVSCVGGKLARHTFPDQGSDADDVLAVEHADLCGPFRVAAKDGSLYFLPLKDRKTRYVWVRPVAKKSDALREFVQWLAVTERQTKRSVLMLRSDRGGEFLGKQFTDFVNGKGIVHDLTCPYTPQQNVMAEREMRTVVELVRTMLLHMGVQHHWWHLALRQAVWVRNCLEKSTLPPGTMPYQEEARIVAGTGMGLHGEVLGPRAAARWKAAAEGQMGPPPRHVGRGQGLGAPGHRRQPGSHHVGRGVLREHVARGVEVGARAGVGPDADQPVNEHLDGDTPFARQGEKWDVAFGAGIAGGRRDEQQVDVGVTSTLIREEQAEEVQLTLEKPAKKAPVGQQPTGEQAAVKPTEVQLDDEGSEAGNDEGDAEESTDSDVVEVQCGPRQSGRIRRLPDFYVPVAFTTAYDEVDDDLRYDDVGEDEDFPELDPDMHADPEHRWDISTMTVKEALASWKGKAVKAAMEEEIRSLIGMGTWELVKRLPEVNIMKNRWVLTTKYHIDDTVECEKARLVVKGFTQVYGADYDETYGPVSSYVMLRIFLSIVAVLDLNLMQLDMKNAFLQSKLDWVLVYVDDLLAASSSTELLKELKELLEAAFELREISPVRKYLGLEIVRDRLARKLWLHQQGYADKLRRRFLDEEQTGRTPKTPVSVDAYAELTFDDEGAQECQEEEYRQKVGLLQFAATTTRPDIAFACSKLGSGLTVRSDQHWREVDRCLAFLTNTRDTTLEFGGGAELLKLVGYVDADDTGDKQNRTSTGGYMFIFGGAAVSWSSQRIKCATLSSTESEYVAATEAGKEGGRLRFLLAKFRQLDAGTPTVLRVDNKSAITFAEGMGLTGNLKHMERRQAWLQHMVKGGKFSLRYIPTAEQPADFLTKALHYPTFNRCSVAVGQVRLADVGDGGNDVQQ
ncbi:unnamed protein product [Closterium sp. NIES-54]